MKRKKNPPDNIFALNGLLHEIGVLLTQRKSLDDEALSLKLDPRLDELRNFERLLDHNRYKGHAIHLENLLWAIAKNRFDKAEVHIARLRAIVHPVSNDSPYKVGDRVWINRYEHGWDVGVGEITRVYGSAPDPVSYSVMLEDGNYEIHVDKTRDLSRA